MATSATDDKSKAAGRFFASPDLDDPEEEKPGFSSLSSTKTSGPFKSFGTGKSAGTAGRKERVVTGKLMGSVGKTKFESKGEPIGMEPVVKGTQKEEPNELDDGPGIRELTTESAAGGKTAKTGASAFGIKKRKSGTGGSSSGAKTASSTRSAGTKKSPGGKTVKYGGPSLSVSIEERSVIVKGKKKMLLRDIRLEIPGGSMVLILGGSGAGKTTFMNAVMGYEKAKKARIVYNGIDLYKNYDKMIYEIGYVPQGHLLRDNDTVYSTLMNAALMRMPSGQPDSVYEEKVEKTLKLFGLYKEKDSLVKKISGGQEKRLSLGEQYIGNPSLFFLDEPDSGLDGPNTKAIMKNLRHIADEGKIVMVISHSPDRIFELFDYVIVLAKDSRENCGRLVYFGAPKDAYAFFEVENLEQIVSRVNSTAEGGEGRADEFIDRFQAVKKA
ncbi:MAG: ABC transporter ATP-binding protein [Oscillospiraceae bacterium]|nr:ABC transporter ATP-binding protein [Oscillospiraceae bacterium]